MTDFEQRSIISGIGQSDVGRRLGRRGLDLTLDAALEAIADAGLTVADIDGIATYPGAGGGAGPGFSGPGTPEVQDALRLNVRWHSGGIEGAAQLAADQAQVDAAEAALAVAQQNLAQAIIVSPMAGTVSAVGLTVGGHATAGSSSSAVIIIGDTHVVTIAVNVTKVPQVAVGQVAEVTPDGGAAAVTAKVTRVGVAPTTGPSYAVVLGLTGAVAGLRDGTSASVCRRNPATTARDSSNSASPEGARRCRKSTSLAEWAGQTRTSPSPEGRSRPACRSSRLTSHAISSRSRRGSRVRMWSRIS